MFLCVIHDGSCRLECTIGLPFRRHYKCTKVGQVGPHQSGRSDDNKCTVERHNWCWRTIAQNSAAAAYISSLAHPAVPLPLSLSSACFVFVKISLYLEVKYSMGVICMFCSWLNSPSRRAMLFAKSTAGTSCFTFFVSIS